MRVAVLGAGAWGTTLAALWAPQVETVLWARRAELAATITAEHRNPDYLPGVALAPQLGATASLPEAMAGADVVVFASPSAVLPEVARAAAYAVERRAVLLSVAKGLEAGTLRRMSEVLAQAIPGRPVGVLTGPNLAHQVVAGHPTAAVVALSDEGVATQLRELLSTPTFRLYTNGDVVGCEVAGALKNVVAIATGIAAGIGFAENTQAALVTRGLAELARLGQALGGDPLTFSGLAGLGDLVATCTSPESRNRTFGQRLATGLPVAAALASSRGVVEGVRTAAAALELGERHGVELPIVEQVAAVLAGERRVDEVVPALMLREGKAELAGLRRRRNPAPPWLPALVATLRAHDPVDAREEAARTGILDALERLEAPFDRHAGPTHVTASALVVGPRGVLLHRHRRYRRWMQPGGHLEPGETPWDGAQRETLEETGIAGVHPASGPVLLHVDVHPAGEHVHLDLRYLLLGGEAEPSPPAGESQEVRWFGLEEAVGAADEALRGALVRLADLPGAAALRAADVDSTAGPALPAKSQASDAATTTTSEAIATPPE